MALWFFVDDDAADRAIMEAALARIDGVEAEFFASGCELLQRLDEGATPQLVIIDVGLPDLAGSEVIAEIREHDSTSALPVIALSGNTDPDMVARVYRNGGNSYFEKPQGLAATVELFDELSRHWSRALLPG